MGRFRAWGSDAVAGEASDPAPRTAYEDRLELHGSGPLVVYVPGIDGTGQLFYRQIPPFLKAGFSVATYRLRDGATRVETLVEDLDDVISQATGTSIPSPAAPGASTSSGEDSAPGGRVTLVGESFGGALAMRYALTRPARIARMMIVNSFARFDRPAMLSLGIALLPLIGWHTLAGLRRLIAFRLHSRGTPRSEIRRFLELTDETTIHGYVNRLRVLQRYDLRNDLAELDVPTLFVAADRDRLLPAVREANRMHRLAPGSGVRVLEDHGHICLVAPGVDLSEILLAWEAEAAT